MKINEVEALVGITRKNIRFYEAEGLLSPRRNSQNGYRDYGETEVEVLRRIKLLRKLGLPLEEIRQMQHGAYTVGDGMRRHLVSLERERQNLEAAIRFCGTLTDRRERLEELDAQSLLDRMAQMEQEGTTFMNKQKQDTRRRRFVAPIVVAIVMSVLMAGLIWLFLWAFEVDPAGAPPLPVLALFVAIPAAVVVGVVIALVQRVREIERGVEEDARKDRAAGLRTRCGVRRRNGQMEAGCGRGVAVGAAGLFPQRCGIRSAGGSGRCPGSRADPAGAGPAGPLERDQRRRII